MRLSFSESEIDPKTQLGPTVDRDTPEPHSKQELAGDWVDPDKTRVVPALELAARRTVLTASPEETKAEDEKEQKTFLGLNLPQVIGGVLASTTAAILGGQLGVAGTIVGAAMTTGIITVGGALYTHGITKTHTGLGTVASRFRPGTRVLKETSEIGAAEQLTLADAPAEEPAAGSWRDKISPWKLLATAAAIFLLAAVVVTGLEALRGESFAGGGPTTVGQVSREGLSNPSGSSSTSETERDSGPTEPQREATQPAASAEPTVQQTQEPAPTTEPVPTTEPTQTTAPTIEPGPGSADGSTGSDSTSDRTDTDGTDSGETGGSTQDGGSDPTRSGGTGSDTTGSGTTGSGTTGPGTTDQGTSDSGSNTTNSLSENGPIVERAPLGE